MDPIFLYLLLVIVGILAGAFGGLIGTGGCAIMLPVLFFVFYEGDTTLLPLAIGTTLFAVVFTSISGAIGHLKIKNLHKETALYLSIGGSIGVIVGSLIFSYIVATGQLTLLSFILGLIFVWPAIRMIREGIKKIQLPKEMSKEIPGSSLYKTIFGFIIGVTTGIAGLGGGYALVPGMIYLFGAPVYVTMGTSLATMIPLTIIGSAFKIYNGVVDVIAGLSLGLGTTIGAQIGSRLIKRFKPYTLKLIFGLFFLYVSMKYIFMFFGIRL